MSNRKRTRNEYEDILLQTMREFITDVNKVSKSVSLSILVGLYPAIPRNLIIEEAKDDFVKLKPFAQKKDFEGAKIEILKWKQENASYYKQLFLSSFNEMVCLLDQQPQENKEKVWAYLNTIIVLYERIEKS
jgi:hypothetical protein